jgi:hypothetical protein
MSAKSSQVLWLCGPPECCIQNVSSHIMDILEAKNKHSKKQHCILYFNCSAATTKKSPATSFVQALLQQLICFFPPQKQMAAITAFLRTLLDPILRRDSISNNKRWSFNTQGYLDEMILKILDAPGGEQWNALKAVLDTEHNYELSLIIDRLDKIEHQRGEFIKEVRTLIEQLQEGSTIKVLLTSRPQAEIKGILGGLPVIEYDQERKG